MIYIPNFNRNALEIGNFPIRWYSLAYIAGILATLGFLKHFHTQKISQESLDDWLLWAVLGVVIGGHLGYVLLYNPNFYLKNLWQILAVWEGGMSFHGGLLGSIISMFYFCKKHKINFLEFTDTLAVAAPIGIFFGRIANFINLELYGRVTSSKFGVIFPNTEGLPRHPSQLYEASLEGILLFLFLFCLAKFTKIRQKNGILSALFLIFYGFARIILEQFREPDEQIGLLFYQFTMGQILCMPMIITGFMLIVFILKKNKNINVIIKDF